MNKNKGGFIIGLSFILIGILWMLNNFSIINFEPRFLLMGLSNLWPLILVVIGLNIIIKNKFINRLLWIIFVVVVLVFSYNIQQNTPHPGPNKIDREDIEYHNIPLKGIISSGELDLDLGAVDFYIQSGSIDFATVDTNIQGINFKEEMEEGQQSLYISNEKFFKSFDISKFTFNDYHGYLTVELNEDIPWDIDINSGAVKGLLNLDYITIEDLDIDLGAGDLEVYLGENAPNSSINIDTGVSKIVLNIPKECGIFLKIDGGLNSTNISELDLLKEADNKYISKNYQEAVSKYSIDVDMGLGEFLINYY